MLGSPRIRLCVSEWGVGLVVAQRRTEPSLACWRLDNYSLVLADRGLPELPLVVVAEGRVVYPDPVGPLQEVAPEMR